MEAERVVLRPPVRRGRSHRPESHPARVRLETARTALHDLLKDCGNHTLPVIRRSPRLADYWEKYFTFHETVKDAKRGSTLRREKSARRNWLGHLGEIRLNEIKRFHLNGYLAKRQAASTSPRTVNREMIALRNVLKRAVDDDLLKTLPMENLRPLPVDQRKRPLVTPEQLENIFAAAAALPRSGELLADVLRFMAASGARIAETLRLRWSDVNFARRQISIGSDGLAKNRKPRVVDFNPPLEAHLRDMQVRQRQISAWLYPSPRRVESDGSIVNFNKALRSACDRAGMPDFGFHDCRHYFISHCVMSGIDFFMTV